MTARLEPAEKKRRKQAQDRRYVDENYDGNGGVGHNVVPDDYVAWVVRAYGPGPADGVKFHDGRGVWRTEQTMIEIEDIFG